MLTAGKFGERWRDLAKAFGCVVDVLSAPYGETLSLDDIRQKLTPDVRAVYVQATELLLQERIVVRHVRPAWHIKPPARASRITALPGSQLALES